MQLDNKTDARILYVYYAPSWGKFWQGAVIITYRNFEKQGAMLAATLPLLEEMKPNIKARLDENTIKCLEVRCGVNIEKFVERIELALIESNCSVSVKNDTETP